MGNIIKDRRNPPLEESVKELPRQILEKLIEFDLKKIEENYNERLDASLKMMIKEYEERFKDTKFAKDTDTIIKLKEYEEGIKKFCKQGIVYSR